LSVDSHITCPYYATKNNCATPVTKEIKMVRLVLHYLFAIGILTVYGAQV
jgi:hypothetical protein